MDKAATDRLAGLLKLVRALQPLLYDVTDEGKFAEFQKAFERMDAVVQSTSNIEGILVRQLKDYEHLELPELLEFVKLFFNLFASRPLIYTMYLIKPNDDLKIVNLNIMLNCILDYFSNIFHKFESVLVWWLLIGIIQQAVYALQISRYFCFVVLLFWRYLNNCINTE